jgi:hypothetical protein
MRGETLRDLTIGAGFSHQEFIDAFVPFFLRRADDGVSGNNLLDYALLGKMKIQMSGYATRHWDELDQTIPSIKGTAKVLAVTSASRTRPWQR